jgi:hypothetical protein
MKLISFGDAFGEKSRVVNILVQKIISINSRSMATL